MVSREPLLLMVAADRREFAGFSEARPVQTSACWSAQVRLHGRQCLLLANGVGRSNASRAVDEACGEFDIELVVSTGYAGAITPKLQMGNILVVSLVREQQRSLDYPVSLPDYIPAEGVGQGGLLTIDHIAHSAEEKSRLATTGFDAVDMEASAVAAVAQQRCLPFYCVRVISDDASTDLEIDFNRARRADGTISGWSVLGQAIPNPRRWPRLNELRKNASSASRSLGKFLSECQFSSHRR